MSSARWSPRLWLLVWALGGTSLMTAVGLGTVTLTSGGGTPAAGVEVAAFAPSATPTSLLPTPTRPPNTSPSIRTYFVPPEPDQSVHDALADGVVTRAEYDRAVANNMACLDDKGVQHSAPVYEESSHQYRYSMTHTGPVPYAGLSPSDECYMRYEQDIHSQWVRQAQR